MSEREAPRPAESEDEAAVRLLRLAGSRRPVPAGAEARVRAAVREHWLQRSAEARRRRHRLRWALGVAAAAVIVVAASVSLTRGPATAPLATVEVVEGPVSVFTGGASLGARVGLALAAGGVVSTGPGGRVALRLPGGESLRVDEDSRAVVVGAATLRLEAGAVYLDGGPAAGGRGVRLATPFGDVRDVGTQYEVRLAEGALRISVREGLVRLSRTGGDEEVAAGEQLRVAGDGTTSRARIAAADPMWAWVVEIAPSFRLEGSTVAALLAWSGRETGRPVVWSPEADRAAAERIVLHGGGVGIGPDDAPAVLATCGLSARFEEGALIVGVSRP